ncbi:hypothetical protein D3C80_127980 [compost metagenome]
MISNTDIERFVASISFNSAAVLDVMKDTEDWVVDGEDGPQSKINVLAQLLHEPDGLARFNSIDPALRLQAILHMNAHRFTILLQAMSDLDTSSVATLLENQPASNNLYILRYLLRFIMMLRHQMVDDIFGVERLAEIKNMLDITTQKITITPQAERSEPLVENGDEPWSN